MCHAAATRRTDTVLASDCRAVFWSSSNNWRAFLCTFSATPERGLLRTFCERNRVLRNLFRGLCHKPDSLKKKCPLIFPVCPIRWHVFFEPALPFKQSMLGKDSNSRLQLQVSRWPWIANKAPQLATLNFTLRSHF